MCNIFWLLCKKFENRNDKKHTKNTKYTEKNPSIYGIPLKESIKLVGWRLINYIYII